MGRYGKLYIATLMIESFRASLEALSRQGMERRKTEASLQQVQNGHVELVELIGKGDAEGAAACMHPHLESTLRILCGHTARSPARPS